MNGVIQTSTGYLLRHGGCDYSVDGSFDAANETYVTDVPEPGYSINYPNENDECHKWNGSSWELIPIIDTISLTKYKRSKTDTIDIRTGELIAQGFSYADKIFSLSGNAQTNILALFTTRGHVALAYPIQYSTIDDADSYNVVDATDVENMYLAALGTKRAHLDSGNALKDQVRAATDKAEVDAVTDNR